MSEVICTNLDYAQYSCAPKRHGIDEIIIEARHKPETARSLFALASYGQRDPPSLERLRATFVKEDIPAEFLSDYEPDASFACLRQNDGLSDNF
jgi:hypothetical protein